MTAGSSSQALDLYKAGADYVLRPNFLTASHLLEVLERLLREEGTDWAEKDMERLSQQREVLS